METLDENNFGKNEISATAIKYLRGTGWMKFIGILGIIGSILGGLSILFVFILLFANGRMEELVAMYLFMMVLAIGILGVYAYASLQLFQAANYYELYVAAGKSSDLEMAFKKQRQFWLIVVVITIVSLSLYFIAIFYNMLFIARNF